MEISRIALVMMPLEKLADALGIPKLRSFAVSNTAYEKRDAAKELIAAHLKKNSKADVVPALEDEGILCTEVLDCNAMLAAIDHELTLTQKVRTSHGVGVTTTCPI